MNKWFFHPRVRTISFPWMRYSYEYDATKRQGFLSLIEVTFVDRKERLYCSVHLTENWICFRVFVLRSVHRLRELEIGREKPFRKPPKTILVEGWMKWLIHCVFVGISPEWIGRISKFIFLTFGLPLPRVSFQEKFQFQKLLQGNSEVGTHVP